MKRSSLAIASLAAWAMPILAEGDGPEPSPVAIDMVGHLAPARLVPVEASIPGRVVTLLAEEGDRVRAGDLLAELDDGRLRGELEIAEAGLESARARLREIAADVAAEGPSRSPGKERLAVAEAEVRRAEATRSVAERRLAEAKVKAPIDGTVLDRAVEVGAVVDRSDPRSALLFELADLGELVAVVNVPESNWGRVRKGQSARVGVAAIPGLVIEAEVARISPVIDPETGCFEVQVALESPDEEHRLVPGMFARVSLLEGQ